MRSKSRVEQEETSTDLAEQTAKKKRDNPQITQMTQIRGTAKEEEAEAADFTDCAKGKEETTGTPTWLRPQATPGQAGRDCPARGG